MFSIGAFAIILDEQSRVLLCHRRDFDVWNLPGGGVENGELPTEAVIREVREETGTDHHHQPRAAGPGRGDRLARAAIVAARNGSAALGRGRS